MFQAIIMLATLFFRFTMSIWNSSKYIEVCEVRLGLTAYIPCDLLLSKDVKINPIKVITWYKESYKHPIYRFKKKQLTKSSHWRAGSNRHLAISPASKNPYLVINNTRVGDIGEYRCHILYQGKQETNKYTNLKIIYPPVKPQIRYTKTGIALDKTSVGYKHGDNLSLSCISLGGYPAPTIVWLRDYEPMYLSFQRSTMEANLNIPNLTSSDNGSLLTCKAAQGQMGSFVTTTIKLIEEGSKNLNSTYRDTALNNSTTSISVLKSKVEQKVDNKLKNVINSKEHQYVEYIKTLNKSVLDQHKIKEDNKNPSSPITYTNSKFYGIIIGLCVVFLLFELIVMITIVNVMR